MNQHAGGFVVEHRYNTQGKESSLIRYASKVDVEHVAGTAYRLADLVAWASKPQQTGLLSAREVRTSYDLAGQITSVQEVSQGWMLKVAGDGSGDRYEFGSPLTSYSYNSFGEVTEVRVSLLKSGYTGPGDLVSLTTYLYDANGRKTAEVDPLGFVTTFKYDAVGNMTERREYANAASNRATAAVASTSAKDRIFLYEFDAENRLTKETRSDTEFFSVSPTGDSITSQTASVSTEYSYDALGNQTSVRDIYGASTYSYFDVLGRKVAVLSPARAVLGLDEELTPLSEFKHDVFGNVVQRIDYAVGAGADAVEAIRVASDYPQRSAGATSADRATWSKFDSHGRLIETTDAEGSSKFFAYDATGQLVREQQTVKVLGGNEQIIRKAFEYDVLGRQTQEIQFLSTGSIEKVNTFNAFGEVTQRTVQSSPVVGASASTVVEYYKYDELGRVWSTNAGDGIDKVILYDATGTKSMEVTSISKSGVIAGMTSVMAADLDSDDYKRVKFVTDELGRIVKTIETQSVTSTSGNWRPSNFEAFYWVESQWDEARNATSEQPWSATTTVRYDALSAKMIFRDESGIETRFIYEEGPLAAIRKSEAFRDATKAMVPVSLGSLDFELLSGYYVPQNYPKYRELETHFRGYFTADDLFPIDGTVAWMGGTLKKISHEEAEFILGQNTLKFYRHEGPLDLMMKSAVIRNGWQKEYDLDLFGEGGEAITHLNVQPTPNYAAGSVSMTWAPIAFLGAGDVRVEILYKTHPSDVELSSDMKVFSARDADLGVTMQATRQMHELRQVKIYKKDVSGKWHELDDSTFLTIQAPADPRSQVIVDVAGNGRYETLFLTEAASTGAALVNFGDRVLLRPSVGINEFTYTVHHLLPGDFKSEATKKATGTVSLLPPVLKNIHLPNLRIDSSGVLAWGNVSNGIDAPVSAWTAEAHLEEVVKARPAYFRPTNYLNFRKQEVSFYAYFESVTIVGERRKLFDYGGQRYDIMRGEDDKAYLIAYNSDPAQESAFEFTRAEGLLSIARRNAVLRNYWSSVSPDPVGFELDANGYFPGTNGDIFRTIEDDFDALFASVDINSSIGWMEGTFKRTGTDTATYTRKESGVDVVYAFSRLDGPLKVIKENAAIRKAMASFYKTSFDQGEWVTINANAIGSHSANFGNTELNLGSGAYQYEILFEKGGKPYAHNVGVVLIDGKTSSFTTGHPTITPIFDNPGTGKILTWSNIAGALRARIAVTPMTNGVASGSRSSWIEAALVNGKFSADLTTQLTVLGQSGGDFEYELEFITGNRIVGASKGLLSIEGAGGGGGLGLFPINDLPQKEIYSIPLPDPQQYLSITHDGDRIYTQPVVTSIDPFTGIWAFGEGYFAPIERYDYARGIPVYGDAIAWGQKSAARLSWQDSGVPSELIAIAQDGQHHYFEMTHEGGRVIADLAGLQPGSYEYVLNYYDYFEPDGTPQLGQGQQRGDLRARQTGSFELTAGSMGSFQNTTRSIPSHDTIHITDYGTWARIGWDGPGTLVDASLRYRKVGATQWTQGPLEWARDENFVGPMWVELQNLSGGQYEFEIAYSQWDGNPATHASDASQVMYRSTGTFSVNDTPAGYVPSYPTQLEQYFNGYFAGTPRGVIQAAVGGSIVRGNDVNGAGTAHYLTGDVYAFQYSDGVQSLLVNSPTLRNHWSWYYNMNFSHQPAVWTASDYGVVATIQSDFTAYFNDQATYPINSHGPWCGGDLRRYDENWAVFTDPNGVQTWISRWTPVMEAVAASSYIKSGLEGSYTVQFYHTPESYTPDNVAGYNQLLADYEAFFHSGYVEAGQALAFGTGGALIRGYGDSAYFASTGVTTFSQSTGAAALGSANTGLRSTWQYWWGGVGAFYFSNGSRSHSIQVAPAVSGYGQPVGQTNASIQTETDPFSGSGSGGTPDSMEVTPYLNANFYKNFVATQGTYGVTEEPSPSIYALSLSRSGSAFEPRVTASGLYNSGTKVLGTVTQTYDRWGNVLTQTDSRSADWVTSYEYNDLNQLTRETKPTVGVAHVNGSVAYASTTTEIYHDALGRVVGMRDANGNVSAQVYDAAGQLILERHADGGKVAHTYNIYGNKISTKDALGNITRFAYDNLGQLEGIVRPKVQVVESVNPHSFSIKQGVERNRVETFGYDAAGRRVVSTNGAGEVTRTSFDERGLITSETHYLRGTTAVEDAHRGLITEYGWDQFGNKVRELRWNGQYSVSRPTDASARTANSNADLQTWKFDVDGVWGVGAAYGRVLSHTNIGGQQTRYAYNGLGLVQSQTKGTDANPTQELLYRYDQAGRLIRMDDTVERSVTTYEYDKAGNKLTERFEKDGVTYQDNRYTYDAQGRLTRVIDDRHDVRLSYDANGNRRQISGYFYDDESNVRIVNNLYEYDAMNRMTLENGVYDGDDNINGTQGTRYTYDLAGNKITETKFGKLYNVQGAPGTLNADNAKVTHRFTYDTENRLIRVEQDAPAGQSPSDTSEHANGSVRDDEGKIASNVMLTRQYDAASRVVDELTVNLGAQGNNIPINATSSQDGGDARGDRVFSMYDAQGRLVEQFARDFKGGQRYKVEYSGAGMGYDGVGNLLGYKLTYRPKGSGSDFTETNSITLERADGYRETQVAKVHNGPGDNRTGTSSFKYDANGNLKSVFNHQQTTENRHFITDTQGNVLRRVDGMVPGTSETYDPLSNRPLTIGNLRNFGMSGDVKLRHYLVVQGQTLGITGQRVDGTDDEVIRSFDFGAKSASYSNASLGRFVVTQPIANQGLVNGLKTAAQAVYGDASLWYLLADANGLTSNESLKEGMTLIVPAKDSASNSSQTFKPYDPTEIRGDNTPGLPEPPKSDKGCGVLGQIIVAVVSAVVDAVVTFYTGNPNIGAAAGNTAGQLTAMTLGMQDKFDWKQVAAAYATAEFMAQLEAAKLVPAGGPRAPFTEQMHRAFVQNVVSQGVNVTLGIQDKFDWKRVAATTVGAPIANEVGSFVGRGVGGVFGDFAGGIAGRIASGYTTQVAVRAAVGGKVKWQNIVADSFGNALGSAFVGMAMRPGDQMNKLEATVGQAYASGSFEIGGGGLPNVNSRTDFGEPIPHLEYSAPGQLDEMLPIPDIASWFDGPIRAASIYSLGGGGAALGGSGDTAHRYHSPNRATGNIDVIDADGNVFESYKAPANYQWDGPTLGTARSNLLADPRTGLPSFAYTSAVATGFIGTPVKTGNYSSSDDGLTVGPGLLDLEVGLGTNVGFDHESGRRFATGLTQDLPKGIIQGAYVFGADIYRGYQMTGALMLGSIGLASPEYVDRHIDYYSKKNYRIFDYSPGVGQAFGFTGEFASPFAWGKALNGAFRAEQAIFAFTDATAARLRGVGLPDWTINWTQPSPGTLYSNPLQSPFTLESITFDPSTRVNFGAHLRGLIGDPPPGMIDPHAHHIVFKRGIGAEQQALVREGHAILREYGIDPILGKENLIWAPWRVAKQHSIDSLSGVVDELRVIKQMGGSRVDIESVLTRHGQLAATRGK